MTLMEPDVPGAVSRTPWACGLKRIFDLVVGALVLLLISPVLLLAMALIRSSGPGPMFFMQTRTGRHGHEFRPYKLRTMRSGRTPDPNELVPLDHPDVTRVGHVLRRLKIDELPQLLNVVLGDMSFVGPRPTLPEQTRQYDDFQRRRLLVRPGITGLAQVNGNTAIPWNERIRYDVYYVEHHGFRMDLAILLKTILVVLRGEEHFARPFARSPYANAASMGASRAARFGGAP